MTGWRRYIGVLGAATALTLAVAACGSGGSGGEGSGSAPQPVTILLTSDVDSLDPALGSGFFSRELYPLTYDTLISHDDETGKTYSQLAEKWDIKPDGATFTLRKHVTCGDGTPLTASVVADNLNRIKDPKVNAPFTSTFFGTTDYDVSSDDAARTVTIKLSRPYGFLAHGIARGPAIVCKKGLDDPGMLKTKSDGSGPYTLTEAVPGDHYTFTLRKGYTWGSDGATSQGLPPKVTAKVVTSEATQVNLLQSGQADLAYLTAPTSLKRARSADLTEVPDLGTPQNLLFNERSAHPGADPAVRRALGMALDRDALAKVLSGGLAKAADSLLGTGAVCNAPDKVASFLPRHDAAAAERALADAGWAKDASGKLAKDGRKLTMTLLLDQSEANRAAGELVRTAWQKLGVEVKVDSRAEGQLNSMLFAGKRWDATVVGVGSNIPAAVTSLYSGPTPPRGTNFASVDNKTYNRVVEQAHGLTGEKGCSRWQEGERALFGEGDVVPLVVTPAVWFARDLKVKLMPFIQPTSLRTTG